MAPSVRLEITAAASAEASAEANPEVVARLAQVVFDCPDRAVNVLGTRELAELEAIVGQLEAAARGGEIRGVILRSGKPGVFLAGADLDELAGAAHAANAASAASAAGAANNEAGLERAAQQAEEWLRRGQQTLARLRRLPIPSVAALDGAALGGGLEVALACTYRVASSRREMVLGMPELQLGLLPALGGTWSVAARVGLRRGLELLLTSRRVRAAEALRIGLVDELVAPESLLAAACRWAVERPRSRRLPWRERLAASPIVRPALLRAARRAVTRKTGTHLPAPWRLLEAVEAGLRAGPAAAEAAERRSFGRLATSAQSRNLVWLFHAGREAQSGQSGRAPSEGARTLGILGAGFMGGGIAVLAARRGFAVRVHDQRAAAMGRVLRTLREKPGAARDAFRVTTSFDPHGFRRCDCVIEAVSEDLETKRALLAAIEGELREIALVASNTSTIPIAQIAKGLRYPSRVLGLHFFSPVERMPLVEIVRHSTTGDPFVERAKDLVRRLGKTPVVVRDGPGFFTTRVLAPYLAQGARMVLEGVPIRAVDAAARAAGFPVGPLELLDEVGLDIAFGAARVLAEAFPERMPAPREFKVLVENGRLGRKVGRGFYDYKHERKKPDDEVEGLLSKDLPTRTPTPEAIAERLLWALVCESVRALEDGVLMRPEDGDLAAVLGIGFPPWLGGPFRWLESIGREEARRRLGALAERHGAAFEVPATLATPR